MSHTANANLTAVVVEPIKPTAEDMDSARKFLSIMPGRRDQAEYVVGYIGQVLESVAKGRADDNSVRRGIALYRAWGGQE